MGTRKAGALPPQQVNLGPVALLVILGRELGQLLG